MDALFNNGYVQLYHADARQLPIPDESIDCVVTSPPYWGLRDYGLGGWVGGDEDCEHRGIVLGNNRNFVDREGRGSNNPSLSSGTCQKCGAIKASDGIGLEATPEDFCANMVEVFREVWRVLKPTGTVWMNLGDSYTGSGVHPGGGDIQKGNIGATNTTLPPKKGKNLKPKDLVGIPWRVAFALQADGWYLRSDIIWSKPNPMPESVSDRPTKAHEYIFLLTKSPRYYYDADAIKEPMSAASMIRNQSGWNGNQERDYAGGTQNHLSKYLGSDNAKEATHRNKRSVWEITTQPYAEAHFATYPEKLVEPCILAGCPLNGVVLDPFVGSGTTLSVAQRLGRRGVGTDLNLEYLTLASKRLSAVSLPMNLGI